MTTMKISNPEDSCFYCGRKKTRLDKIEFHHVFGKINSDLGVYSCESCHHLIHDDLQKELPKIIRQENAPTVLRAVNCLLLWSKHLQQLGSEGERLAIQAIQKIQKEEVNNENSLRKDAGQEEKPRPTKEQ